MSADVNQIEPAPPGEAVSTETVPGQTVDGPMEAEASPAGPARVASPISPFARKIAGVFMTRVGVFAISFTTSIVVARLLDPIGKGEYSAVILLPGMLSSLALLGLPNATNYMSGRGKSVASLIRASIVMTVVLSLIILPAVWLALPFLEKSVLQLAPDNLIKVILVTVPSGMIVSFGGTILYGRQDTRVYNLILLGQVALALLVAIFLIGVLRWGVPGAVAGNVAISLISMVVVLVELRRLGRRDEAGDDVSFRELISYGLRVYPASITGYFNYRADTYIIQALALTVDTGRQALGLYSIAVSMAELIFYIPDSVSTLFLPRVAASTKEEADRMLGRVSRLTVLITLLAAIALIPTVYLGILVVLPRYTGALPAFYAILPGVVVLSNAKVMTSYLNGRGRPGPVSIGSGVALAVNVVSNIFLIPALGIVGASLSSVISYTTLAAIMLFVAARLSGQSALSMIVPTTAEFTLVRDRSIWAARRLAARSRLTARFAR